MNNNLIFTIASPLDQFEVTNLIGINASILKYLNINLINLFTLPLSKLSFVLLFYLIGIFIGVLIKKGYIGLTIQSFVLIESKKIIYKNSIFIFSLFFVLFLLLSLKYYNIELFNLWMNTTPGCDTISSISSNSTNPEIPKGMVDASHAVVNVNNPSGHFSLGVDSARTLGSALTSAGGVAAGVRLAPEMPNVAGKVAAVAGTVALAQTANIMGNIILSNNFNKDETAKKLINITTIESSSPSSAVNNSDNIQYVFNINAIYEEYPLNLLPQLNNLVTIEVSFLLILINALFSSYLANKSINLDDYIKNVHINKIAKYLFYKYINIWSVSSKVLIIWSIVCLAISMALSKLALIIILN